MPIQITHPNQPEKSQPLDTSSASIVTTGFMPPDLIMPVPKSEMDLAASGIFYFFRENPTAEDVDFNFRSQLLATLTEIIVEENGLVDPDEANHDSNEISSPDEQYELNRDYLAEVFEYFYAIKEMTLKNGVPMNPPA